MRNLLLAGAMALASTPALADQTDLSFAVHDIIITNSAAWLGQHLNNVVAYTPLRNQGELLGFFCVLVHWVDIGGAVPGSCLRGSSSMASRASARSAKSSAARRQASRARSRAARWSRARPSELNQPDAGSIRKTASG